MTSIRKYFIYHFKSTFLRFVIIAVLALLLVAISVSVNKETLFFDIFDTSGRQIETNYQSINIGVLNILALIISTVIPILELVPFKNKRNMDTILFLPISRRKMATVHFLNGFIHVFSVNLLCFMAASLMIIIKSAIVYPPRSFFILFAVTILGSFIVYSTTSFIFDRANTTADGVVWLVVYSFAGLIIFTGGTALYANIIDESYYEVEKELENGFLTVSSMSPYSVLICLCYSICDKLFYSFYYVETEDSIEILRSFSEDIEPAHINAAILWLIIAATCAVAFILLFQNKRLEEIGNISSSVFGYKVFLPVLTVAVILINNYKITWVIAMLIVMIVGYIIYRRSIRFKLWDYISIAIGILLPLVFI